MQKRMQYLGQKQGLSALAWLQVSVKDPLQLYLW